METTLSHHSTSESAKLHMAIELSLKSWTLGFAVKSQRKIRRRTIPAGALGSLQLEIDKARKHFRLSEDAPVVSCYEAGRDGFWLHRFLISNGVNNHVVDSCSIEVNRRQRRAKTDRLDVGKLVTMLKRYDGGEHGLWSVVNVPTVEEEDHRQLHRERIALKKERTQHINRIKKLLAIHGLRLTAITNLPRLLSQGRTWDDSPLPTLLRQRLEREYERLQLVEVHIRHIDAQRREVLREGQGVYVEKMRQLKSLRGIGLEGSWTFVSELFGWREIANRRQLAALVGLAPTPYASGGPGREQGISKAGNKRVRALAVEIAWCWLHWQPDSALSKWFNRRFASGTRTRRIGIVALARKLLIALWRFLKTGTPPQGAVFGGKAC